MERTNLSRLVDVPSGSLTCSTTYISAQVVLICGDEQVVFHSRFCFHRFCCTTSRLAGRKTRESTKVLARSSEMHRIVLVVEICRHTAKESDARWCRNGAQELGPTLRIAIRAHETIDVRSTYHVVPVCTSKGTLTWAHIVETKSAIEFLHLVMRKKGQSISDFCVLDALNIGA